ncbi:hypothetical protein LTR56_009843 [Elasticomyces elasticus]|nr:hypothetical protein LTR56_009843 [Elasticomyces elasticus]KAK3659159.1 hypothetical protein LTR22_008622 [Elasticomyces elasticus]KAK4923163.1 hypothetical protein LTR49_009631 [Elasticomyces elasticus]KAK5761548.1 hypothetical protein LTS12_008340 [Elasticomyces elasticus]
MAHAATVGELATSLVRSLTGITRDDSIFGGLKDRTIKGLRDGGHGRVNPFEIKDRCAGLVEKFGVLNRDDLAEALQSRLDSLPETRWIPDVLSLLLQLSNRPLENASLSDLDGLTAVFSPPPELTWEDIVADGPLTDDDAWGEVERGYHSSGDDEVFDGSDSEPTTSTQATSFAEDDIAALARLHIVKPDAILLGDVRTARETLSRPRDSSDVNAVSELILIRETISMLRGLPTDLFSVGSGAVVSISSNLCIATASKPMLYHLLSNFAEIGSQLVFLRHWTQQKRSEAYVQSIQAAVQSTTGTIDLNIGRLEQRFIEPPDSCVVSLIDVRIEVEEFTRAAIHLSSIIAANDRASNGDKSSSFALLDALYEEACVADMAGDKQLFNAIARALLAGIRTYLRPVLLWVSSGDLPKQGADTFFVRPGVEDCPLSEIWHKRFALRLQTGGRACAPEVMQPFIEQLYAAGKEKAFLKLNGHEADESVVDAVSLTARLSMATVTERLTPNSLMSFDELLHELLQDCFAGTRSPDTTTLRTVMLEHVDLLRHTRALNDVFLGHDGMSLQAFTGSLFGLLQRGSSNWHDKFFLTRLVQSTLGAAPIVHGHCITVSVLTDDNHPARGPISRQLARIKLAYAVPCPVQNVTRSADLPTYSAAFSLLLQIEYAAYVLSSQTFDLRKLGFGWRSAGPALQETLSLRERLIWFIGILRSHYGTVITTHADGLRRGLEAANGIDSMAEIWATHDKHLRLCLLLAPNVAPLIDAVKHILRLSESLEDAWPSLLDQSTSLPAVTRMAAEFDKILAFVAAGLRSVSRAGGVPALEALAERLQWNAG